MSSNFDNGAGARLAVGAIFKNEGPYILEWIAFHKAVGFSRFFIADNASDDGTTHLLSFLAKAGIVEHVPFPGEAGRPPQLPAYSEIMRRFSDRMDWIAFIDADEFIVPLDGSNSILPALEDMPSDVGAVAINWAVYGSSYQAIPSAGLVIERFNRRGKHDMTANHHYKTLLRTVAYRSVHGNPHLFKIKDGWRYAHADGSGVEDHPKHGPGLSREVRWSPFRVNHYVVKSRAEFDHKKAPRGRATSLTARRENGFFVGHDRNEVEEPLPDRLIAACKAGVEELKRGLRTLGCDEWVVSLDSSIAGLRPLTYTPFERGKGVIDKISIVDDMLVVEGWALAPDRTRPDGLSVKVGQHVPKLVDFSWYSRDDVVRKYAGAERESGFRIALRLDELPEAVLGGPTLRVVLKNRRSILRLTGKLVLDRTGA